jgi:hypothetical protein
MPTLFKHEVKTQIGTTPVDIVQVPEGFRTTVVGLNLANTTDNDTINVDVYVISEDSVQAVYVRGITIPPNTAVKVITGGEKLILPESAGLRINSDINNSVDATISFVEIS